MKNLANCTPTEFVTQTVKIKKVVKDWMDATKIMEILKTQPKYITLEAGASAEKRAEVIRKNAEIEQAQNRKNASRIFDAALEENPTKTLELMALCCFVEPSEVDSHPIGWYLTAINELINDENVMSFFSLLAQWGQKNTLKR